MLEFLMPDVGLLLLCFVLKHCGVIEMELYVPACVKRWADGMVQDLPEWERL